MDYEVFLERLIDVKVKEVNKRFYAIDKSKFKNSVIYLIYAKSKSSNIPPNQFYVGVTATMLSTRLKQHIRESFSYKETKTTKKIEWIKNIILLNGELEIIELVRVPHVNKKIRYIIEEEFINYFRKNGLNLTNCY